MQNQSEVAEVAVETCKTILIVDNDPLILDAFRSFLTREGHRVIGARCVAEAIQQLFKERVDLVITEIELLGLSATGLPGLIKQIDGDLPVIVVSDRIEGVGEVPGLKGKADLFLNKPLDLGEIRAAIGELLVQERIRRGTGAVRCSYKTMEGI